jgi:hypothetical protein
MQQNPQRKHSLVNAKPWIDTEELMGKVLGLMSSGLSSKYNAKII